MTKSGIHWFRQDLRIHDNPALMQCIDEVSRFIPIFIFDGKTAGTENCGFVRYRFLLQSLKNLEIQFAKFDIRFMCFYGDPTEVLAKLFKEWDVKVLSFEKDSEATWKKRDNAVRELCAKSNVQVIECVSHTLYDPDEIFSMNNDMPPNTCQKLRELCLRLGDPKEPEPMPDFNFYKTVFKSTDDLYEANLHKVPDCDRFGVEPDCPEQEVCLFEGGETKALQLFKKRLEYEKEFFKGGFTNPNLSKPVLFTKEVSLSPYIRFGCLSVRKFYWDIKRYYSKYYNGETDEIAYTPAEQLFWREYFYQLSYKNENFDKVENNSMCFNIPWNWSNGVEEMFAKWENGKTGYPWIDAAMRQLKQEGWIHHVCRNSVAVFLTRGDLFLSWDKGLKTFLHYQIDADWSVCSGNWNWISCGDPEEILNPTITFCPIKHGKKMDPEGDFIKKYIPELKDYPIEYIFDPWKAPMEVQEKANCIIGKDYPEPCVNHDEAFSENIIKLKQFFNSERREIFDQFVNDKNVLKPANFEEYTVYTNAKFLEFDELPYKKYQQNKLSRTIKK